MVTVCAFAQGPSAAENQERITALKPPSGAKVAIVVFEDLQCPDCARAHPLVNEVSAAQKVPVVRHDFPLAQHPYAMQAAIIGRYLDSQSAKLGEEWRSWVFSNQPSITRDNIDSFFEKFLKDHKLNPPMILDPGGKFDAKIKADVALGKRIGIQHTPTLFIVSNTGKGEPFVEVVDRPLMAQMIEDMKASAAVKTKVK